MSESVTYVIGDIHGEAARLSRLHGLIFSCHRNDHAGQPMKIVHLGDYVDRGPDSAGVIDLVISLESTPEMAVVSLAGNHEEMLIAATKSPSVATYKNWFENGGDATLESYRRRGEACVPDRHLDWMTGLARIHIDEPERRIFVHAGINPATFPNENDRTYLWTRSSQFFDVGNWQGTNVEGWTIIHGHTPTADGYPEDEASSGFGRRINIDTGAVYGGRLTCAVLAPGQDVRYLYA